MSSETPVTSVSGPDNRTPADASGTSGGHVRTPSESPDARRKREARAQRNNPAATSATSRTSATPVKPKGNPSWSWPFRIPTGAGDAIGPKEATDQLFYGHLAMAKVMRSKLGDKDTMQRELGEEFDIAGTNFAYVANHIWTPLRVMIRVIAPLVLIACLVVIWGSIVAGTTWVDSLRDWWRNGRGEKPAASPGSQRDASRALVDLDPLRARATQAARSEPTSDTTEPASSVGEGTDTTDQVVEPAVPVPPVPRRPLHNNAFRRIRGGL